MKKTSNFKKPKERVNNVLNYSGNKGPLIGARHVQVLMTSFCIAIGFSSKSMFSVAIVAMTTNSTSSNSNVPTYEWDNTNVIISAILWCGIPFNLIGGYLGKRYGPKWFAVGSSIVNSLWFILIPAAAQYADSTGVIICRVIQGVALGFLFPLNTVVMGRWVPPEERSRLGYISSSILTLSLTSTTAATGYIAESPLGWPWVFYIIGGIGLAMAALCALISVQSPDAHKSISPEEKQYLLDTLYITEDNVFTPWAKILKCKHVWAVVVADIGLNWTVVMITSEMSIFLNKVMQFDVKMNGIVSALPSLVGTISCAGISVLSDYIPNRGILSVVNSRRMFHIVGTIGVLLSFVFVTMIPVEHRVWAVVLICCINVFVLTSSIGGSTTNILDVSPKFAGIIYGLCQTISQSVALFAPLMVHWVCTDQTSASQWRIVFITSGIIFVATGIVFAIFATDKRQDWEKETKEEAQIERQRRKSSIISISAGIGP